MATVKEVTSKGILKVCLFREVIRLVGLIFTFERACESSEVILPRFCSFVHGPRSGDKLRTTTPS